MNLPNIWHKDPLKIYAVFLPFLLLFFRGLADVTVVLTAVVFLWHSRKNNNWRWATEGWFALSFITWIYVVIVSTPYGYDPGKGIGYALSYIRWPIFAAAIAYWIFTKQSVRTLFGKSLLVALVIILFDTFWQHIFNTDLIFGSEKVGRYASYRLTGPMRGPFVGSLVLRVFYIGLFTLPIIMMARHTFIRIGSVITALVTGLLFTFVTGERMTFLLFSITFIFVYAGLFLEHPKYRKYLLAGLTLSIILFIVAANIVLHPSVYYRAITSVINAIRWFEDDAYYRVFTTSLSVWSHHPITGVGMHNYSEACYNYFNHNIWLCQRHPHNIYLEWLVENGVIGLILFSATVLTIIAKVVNSFRGSLQWFLISCVAASLFVLFWPISAAPSYINNWFASLNWLCLGWILAMAGTVKDNALTKQLHHDQVCQQKKKRLFTA